MYEKNLRPSEIIANQKRVIAQQDAIIETLKAALAAADIKPTTSDLPFLDNLTQQERALVGALYSAYPRSIDKYDLLEMLPGWARALDRQVQIVSVRVHHVRKKLGAETIENIRGTGYRLGGALYRQMRGEAAAEVRFAEAA